MAVPKGPLGGCLYFLDYILPGICSFHLLYCLEQWFSNCDVWQNHLGSWWDTETQAHWHRTGPRPLHFTKFSRNLDPYQSVSFKRDLIAFNGAISKVFCDAQAHSQLFCLDQGSCHRQIPASCCHLIFYLASPADLINYHLFSDMVCNNICSPDATLSRRH